MPDRSVAPSHTSSFKVNFQKVQTHHLDNDILLHTLQAGTQPVLKIEVLYPAGGSYYEEKPAVSLMALKMLKEGTLTHTSSQLSAHFAQYGAFIDISPSFDVPSVSLYCLARHLKKILPYFKEVVNMPVFPNTALKRIRQIEIQQLRMQQERTGITASKKFRNLIFGNENPYGRVLDEQHLEEINTNDLQLFHQKYLTGYEIIASGAVDSEVINEINLAFGKTSKGSIADPTVRSQHPHEGKRHLKEAKQGALQSSIRMGKQIIGKTHKDYIPLLITSHILGGYFGSRLMKNIREDKGYTYGISSSLVALKHNTWFVIGTDVKKEFAEETIAEIKLELATLCEKPVGDQELNTVKNQMLGHFQSEINSAFSLADKFKNINIHGLDYSYYERFLSTLEAIRSEEILSIANQYLNSDSMKTVVVG